MMVDKMQEILNPAEYEKDAATLNLTPEDSTNIPLLEGMGLEISVPSPVTTGDKIRKASEDGQSESFSSQTQKTNLQNFNTVPEELIENSSGYLVQSCNNDETMSSRVPDDGTICKENSTMILNDKDSDTSTLSETSPQSSVDVNFIHSELFSEKEIRDSEECNSCNKRNTIESHCDSKSLNLNSCFFELENNIQGRQRIRNELFKTEISEQKTDDEVDNILKGYEVSEAEINHILKSEAEKQIVDSERKHLVDSEGKHFVDSEEKQFVDSEEKHSVDSEKKHIVDNEEKHIVDNEEKHIVDSEEKHIVDSEEKHIVDNEEKHIVDSEEKHIVDSEENHIVDSEDKHIVDSEEKHIVDSEEKHIVDSEESHIVDSEEKHIVDSEEKQIVDSEEKQIVDSEEKHIMDSEENHIVDSEEIHNEDSEDNHIVDGEKNHIVDSEENHIVDSEVKQIVNSEEKKIVNSEEKHFVVSEENHIVDCEENHIVDNEENHIVDSEENYTVDSEENCILKSEESHILKDKEIPISKGKGDHGLKSEIKHIMESEENHFLKDYSSKSKVHYQNNDKINNCKIDNQINNNNCDRNKYENQNIETSEGYIDHENIDQNDDENHDQNNNESYDQIGAICDLKDEIQSDKENNNTENDELGVNIIPIKFDSGETLNVVELGNDESAYQCKNVFAAHLVEESDSESESSTVNFVDILSNMAELRLEQCNVDTCSIGSHNLSELEQDRINTVNLPKSLLLRRVSSCRKKEVRFKESADSSEQTADKIEDRNKKDYSIPSHSYSNWCNGSGIRELSYSDSELETRSPRTAPLKKIEKATSDHIYDVVRQPPRPLQSVEVLEKQVSHPVNESDTSNSVNPVIDPIYEDIDVVQQHSDKNDSNSRSSRSSTMSGGPPWGEEDRLYTDIPDNELLCPPSPGGSIAPRISRSSTGADSESSTWLPKRLQSHKQLSSSDSWGSEDFESYSSNEEEEKTPPPSTNEPENFRQRLLRKREKWRERRQSSRNLKFSLKKDSKDDKDSCGSSTPKDIESENAAENSNENRFYRWFSIRKNYSLDRKSGVQGGDRTSFTGPSPTSSTPIVNGSSHTLNCNGSAHPLQRMPRVQEEADQEGLLGGGPFEGLLGSVPLHKRHQAPSLPPPPPGLSPEQIKRRHIVASIVHSENNYVNTLNRLVNDFKKPLEDSKPPILNSNKLDTLFHRLAEIAECHALFRIALTECVRHWDRDERIGDVFVASFSKSVVLDVYSDFINNFQRAIELAKQEAKKKSAFGDFLKMRQITSNDRLSFFGLMVKPVQRFPQFILFLQDLLKHTPQGHHDRMSLQLALTQLESLAEMLNERKREAEQYQAFRDTLKHINTKFALRGLGDGNRYLLRQDNATQLEFNHNGMICKTKDRRLFLTNDCVICVSVVPKSGDDFLQQQHQHSERLSLKWAYPVSDVEIMDTSSSLTLSRLLAAGLNRSGSINSYRIPEESLGANKVDNLFQEMNDLMHDYEIVSRISNLVSSLKGSYEGLNQSLIHSVSTGIQRAMHQKDEQMAWIDACCLQFSVKSKDGKEKETFTFQTDNPTVKKDWIVELRLAQLALDKNNSPAWHLPDTEIRPSTKMPLFVKALPVFSSKHQTEVKCGCCYTVSGGRPSRSTNRQQTFIWLCSSDGVSSHLTVFQMQQVGLREILKLDLTEMCVSALQHVPALATVAAIGDDNPSLKSHTIWMGTDSHRLLVYSGLEPEKQLELSNTGVPSSITTIKYYCDQVFVGLNNGSVQVYRRGIEGLWLVNEPITIKLGPHPIMALLPISTHIYASCGNQVHVIDCFTAQIMKEFEVQHENCGGVQMMAHSGIGLWIAQEQSSTICLYHTETFRHLQDINVASNVNRMLFESGNSAAPSKIIVTALVASKGLLWVGTNVGVALTIPLPRLEGVPIISGRANISYHSHLGPITFLLALQPQSGRTGITAPPPDPRLQAHDGADPELHSSEGRSSTVPPDPRLEKQQSDGSLLLKKSTSDVPRLRQQLSSPIMPRRRGGRDSVRDPGRRISKTLPRGLGGAYPLSGSQECDVYGVCGALLNVQNYEDDNFSGGGSECGTNSVAQLSRYDSMRRSDPEIAIPEQLSTLDRRVRLKASRPRSLDLSSWSVDSRASSACTTASSGSEESSSGTVGQSVLPNGSVHRSPAKSASDLPNIKRKEIELPLTLMVLTGGRGYINWQRNESPPPAPNTKDAHIIVWEMKL